MASRAVGDIAMFDLPLPIQPSPRPMGPGTNGGTVASDPSLPFALTRMHRTPAALMSGTAAPVVVERFATLADAMQGAYELAEDNGSDAAPQLHQTGHSSMSQHFRRKKVGRAGQSLR